MWPHRPAADVVALLLAACVSCWMGNLQVAGALAAPGNTTTVRFATALFDHMVLQKAPARAAVWGFSTPGDTVAVTMDDDVKLRPAKAGADGKWKVLLPPTPASSEPHTIVASSAGFKTTIALSDVLFGDVWVCSGQSNMEMTVSATRDPAAAAAESSQYPLIRMVSLARVEADDKPLTDVSLLRHTWQAAAPEAVVTGNPWTYFSATCWFFGLELHKNTGTPLGLVATSWGGTNVEAWSSPDALGQCADKEPSPAAEGGRFGRSPAAVAFDSALFTPSPGIRAPGSAEGSPGGPNSNPSSLWNAMVAPLLDMTIDGAVWYQGESNAANPGVASHGSGYACMFPAMIADWRSKWSQTPGTTAEDFPFGFVQLSGWCQDCSPKSSNSVALVRWAQTGGWGVVPNPTMPRVFMAVSMDLEEEDPTRSPVGEIHPRDKRDVGARLAAAAAADAYPGPVFAGCDLAERGVGEGLSLSLRFALPWGAAAVDASHTHGLDVFSSSTGLWYNVSFVPSTGRSSLVVDISKVPSPAALRYAWRDNPCCPEARLAPSWTCKLRGCALYAPGAEGLPVPPFWAGLGADGRCRRERDPPPEGGLGQI